MDSEHGLGLSDVLQRLRRADEALTECVAPLWPGVSLAAAWMEGRPRLLRVVDTPAEEGYYLLGTEEGVARTIRPAEPGEIRRFLDYLTKATVVLMEEQLAYPSSFAERLQGITAPRPIHFATGEPLTSVQARFDGINLFHDAVAGNARASSPLAGLFGESSIFTPGELLGIPGTEAAGGEAGKVQEEMHKHPERETEYRLRAVLDPTGAVLEDWSREGDRIRCRWRRLEEEHTVLLASAASPITSGISLPGAHGFDPARLTRLLLDHALDPWRA